MQVGAVGFIKVQEFCDCCSCYLSPAIIHNILHNPNWVAQGRIIIMINS